MKQWGILAAKFAISAGLVWWIVGNFDLRVSDIRPARISAGWIVLAMSLLVCQSFVAAFRWKSVLESGGSRIPLMAAWRIVLIGLFFNQTLPSTVGGDAMRVWLVKHRGLSLGHATRSVILDRAIGLTTLLLGAGVLLPMAFDLIEDGILRTMLAAPVVLGAVGGVGAIGIGSRLLKSRLASKLGPVADLLEDAWRIFASRKHVLGTVGASLVIHSASVLVVFCLAKGLNVAIDLLFCLLVVPPAFLAMAIPISIAGWGIREGVMVALLTQVGVTPGEALVLSITFGISIAALGLPGIAIWLATSNEAKCRSQSD